jgi:hypothetical protein
LVLDLDIKTVDDNIYRKRFFSKRINVNSDLVRLLEKTIQERRPLKLFYLWGIHKKDLMNNSDEVALSFLNDVINHIENVMASVSCPIEFTMVLSDAHAELNGVPIESIRSYLAEVSEWAINKGWDVRYLSDLWKNHGLTLDIISEMAKEVTDEAIDGLLMTSASKYYGGDDKKIGAKRYQVARQLEKEIMKKEFTDYIHVSAVDARLLYLQPDLPHFQVWTIKKGISKKPWFINGAE